MKNFSKGNKIFIRAIYWHNTINEKLITYLMTSLTTLLFTISFILIFELSKPMQ